MVWKEEMDSTCQEKGFQVKHSRQSVQQGLDIRRNLEVTGIREGGDTGGRKGEWCPLTKGPEIERERERGEVR